MRALPNPGRPAPAGAMALCLLLFFCGSLSAQYGQIPEAFSQRYLYEPECEAVGTGLAVMQDTTATSDEYLVPNGAVFPESAPGDDPNDYVRLHFNPQSDAAGEYDFEPYFRVRQTAPGPVSLWLRTNGGEWTLRTYSTAYARIADGGWTWVPDVLVHDEENVLGLQGDTLLTLDVAFTRTDQQLDQVYLESVNFYSYYYSALRPFEYDLPGTNCPDFTNLPPVAMLELGSEVIVSVNTNVFNLNAAKSYDPDGVIVHYDFRASTGELDYDYFNPGEPTILWRYGYGVSSTSVTVYDFYGANDKDTSLWKIVHRDYDEGYGPYYRINVQCADAGSNWTLKPDPSIPGGAIAVAPSKSSVSEVPEDVPANKLRFVIPDVPESVNYSTNNYYALGVFSLPEPEGNCLWINTNGTGWHRWEVIEDVSIQLGINLVPGDNVIELAYCSPDLEVRFLNFSPAIGMNYPYTIYRGLDPSSKVADVTCDEPLASEFWLEAECADYGGQWALRNAPDASRGGYLVVDGPNAYSSPPADEPANYVRFSVHIAAAGAYYLQARINAPSNLDDSYYVRINEGPWHAWKSGIRQRAGFRWNLFPGGPLTLDAGHNTIDFAYREDGTELDKIYLGPTADPINGAGAEDPDCELEPLQPIAQWHEAECAPHGAAWTHQPDAEASNGAYLVALDDNSLSTVPPAVPDNLVTFHVDVPATGQGQQLFVYGRIAAAAPDDDSFWVRLNGGEWYAWKTLRHAPGTFKWNRLPFQLPATPSTRHTIEFAYREDGTWLDGIYVTSLDETPDVSSLPPDESCGPEALTLSGSSLNTAQPTSAPAAEISLYPNPVLDELTIELDNEFAGRVFGKVFDAAGRRLRGLQFEKEAGTLRVSLPVTDLAPGVYRLQLVAGDRRWVKTFLRL
ncbi:T9SS type A sorting domain-containing protein [Neolewinella litorea]|uniref:T9SS type A sorting domain-containing protein n=1 Tax=Neolewinella litorea TaxID=2562452 RepID=A0A4S4NLK0_9BACT|nr:T9SS type A sorting domain-containing protein [Neolewinella litorea]THH39835.1 T9SS type A sorting domain-containing protein [Neolewinella litorea]